MSVNETRRKQVLKNEDIWSIIQRMCSTHKQKQGWGLGVMGHSAIFTYLIPSVL